MNSSRVKIHGREYVQVPLMRVTQKAKSFFVGKMDALTLLEIYTVRPAIYDIAKHTSLANSFPDEKEYYNHLTSQKNNILSERDFQRKFKKERVKEIKAFLDEEDYAFFPNSIIVNCDLINDIDDFDINNDSTIEELKQLPIPPSHLSIFLDSEKSPSILVPVKKGSVLVIDGQHRIEGLQASDDSVKNDYEVLLSFVIGVDRSIVAQQFYTINYEQKSVNRSILYHLMGEFSDELDEATFLHKVVKVLNEVKESPFHKRIKMLGSIPSTATTEERGKYSISLAFFIDALSKSISSKKTSSLYQPVFRIYFEDPNRQIELIRFLMRFFKSIQERVPDWDNPSRSLISKGMGIGAMIKVLHLILLREFFKNEDDNKFLELLSTSRIEQLIEGIEKVDFSKNGPFGRSASAGSVNKIKEALVHNLNYFADYSSYQDLINDYKSDNGYVNRFKSWLGRHTSVS